MRLDIVRSTVERQKKKKAKILGANRVNMSTSCFDPSLLDASTLSLPPSLTLRPLQSDDYKHGFDTIYDALVQSDTKLTESTFTSNFNDMRHQSPKVYYPLVLATVPATTDTKDENVASFRIVGCATLLIERKLLRGGSTAAHIEDVVIAPSHQGQKLGKLLIDACVQLASRLECYKIILDCETRNVGFYEKCGFVERGVEMKKYL